MQYAVGDDKYIQNFTPKTYKEEPNGQKENTET